MDASNLTVVGSGQYVYFTAKTSVTDGGNDALWRFDVSDVTPAATEIKGDGNSLGASNLTVVGNDYVCFTAQKTGGENALWWTKTNEDTASEVKDGTRSVDASNLTPVGNSSLFFMAQKGGGDNVLWKVGSGGATATEIRNSLNASIAPCHR